MTARDLERYGKPVLFVLLALPGLWLLPQVIAYISSGSAPALGFNPPETVNRMTGDWAIRTLFLSLTITPFAKLIGSAKPIMFRRMIGLYAFFYVTLHMASYLYLDKLFHWNEIFSDISDRLYISLGLSAFALLIPLALTSNNQAIRWLKAKRWRRLHRLVYPAAILASIHFVMMRKGWQVEPLIYAAVLAGLLGMRLRWRLQRLNRSRV